MTHHDVRCAKHCILWICADISAESACVRRRKLYYYYYYYYYFTSLLRYM